jgi:outer membrane protein, multidrug efflux system
MSSRAIRLLENCGLRIADCGFGRVASRQPPALPFRPSSSGSGPKAQSPKSKAFLLVLLLAGCAVGPDYERPKVDTPAEFRTAASAPPAPPPPGAVEKSLAELGWWDVFDDPQLRQYLTEALANNWDLRIAAARVLQAEANAGAVRSQFFPTVAVGGELVTARTSQAGASPAPPGVDHQVQFGSVFGTMATYEVDLWGRIRRASEAAVAQLLATEEARRTVRQTLVAQVASAYLELLELDHELEIVRRSYDVRSRSLELTTSREQGGVASMQDVVQARVLVSSAQAAEVDVLRRQQQKENELCILLGRNPGPIQRGRPLREQSMRTEVATGLPSGLLERRPDIRSAEQQLVAANASIGEARAAFYPQLTLTGMFGYQSTNLNDLFTGAARMWQFGPSVTLPIFTGGRLTAQHEFALARFDEAVSFYKQTVQGAFRDVSDSLIQYQRSREFTARQEDTTQARRDAADLANVRYDGGVTSYLEVLFSEQDLLTSELELAQAVRNQLLSVVGVYRALGGGWQTPAVAQDSGAPSQP